MGPGHACESLGLISQSYNKQTDKELVGGGHLLDLVECLDDVLGQADILVV